MTTTVVQEANKILARKRLKYSVIFVASIAVIFLATNDITIALVGSFLISLYLLVILRIATARRNTAIAWERRWKPLLEIMPNNWRYNCLIDKEAFVAINEILIYSPNLTYYVEYYSTQENLTFIEKRNKGKLKRYLALQQSGSDLTYYASFLAKKGSNYQAQPICYAPHSSWDNHEVIVYEGVSFYNNLEKMIEHMVFWEDVKARELDAQIRGRQIERDAIQSLKQAIPVDWTMTSNVPLHSGGDADIVLRVGTSKVFVIDIKSYRGQIKIQNGIPVRSDGVNWEDVIKQLKDQSQQLHAIPIVWQPKAQDREPIFIQGVTFIAGDPKNLISHLQNR